MATKRCPKCNSTKKVNQFSKNRTVADGLSSWCKVCHSEFRRAWVLKKKYGISVEEYYDMLDAQGGVCSICGKAPKKKRLAVEHCHACGKVRSLACSRCNYYAIGRLGEDPNFYAKIAEYLREHQCQK